MDILFEDVIIVILNKLSVKDVVNIGQICKYLNNISIWKNRLKSKYRHYTL